MLFTTACLVHGSRSGSLHLFEVEAELSLKCVFDATWSCPEFWKALMEVIEDEHGELYLLVAEDFGNDGRFEDFVTRFFLNLGRISDVFS